MARDSDGVDLVAIKGVDSGGNTVSTPVVQSNLAAGEDIANDVEKVEQRWNYTPITTQTTTLIKTGVGVLGILDYTAAPNGVIKFYDGVDVTGTLMRTITSPATLLENEVNKVFGLSYSVGLCVVTSGANQDIVVGSR